MRMRLVCLLSLLAAGLCTVGLTPRICADQVTISPGRCEDLAREVLEKCALRGGSEEECAQLRDAFLERCLHVAPPPPRPCVEECKARAERALDACLEGGGDADACRQAFNEAAAACPLACNPPPPDCEERCKRHSEDLLA